MVRGLATKRYEFSKYHIFKRNKHLCVAQHLYISDILEFFDDVTGSPENGAKMLHPCF